MSLTNQEALTAILLHCFDAGKRSASNPRLREVLLPDEEMMTEILDSGHSRFPEADALAEKLITSIAQTEKRGIGATVAEFADNIINVQNNVEKFADKALDLFFSPPKKPESGVRVKKARK